MSRNVNNKRPSQRQRLALYVGGILLAANVLVILVAYLWWMSASEITTPLAPHRMRLNVINTLRRETPTESVTNLPHFDDTVMTLGDVDADIVYDHLSYNYTIQYIPKLSRVRKLIEDGRNSTATKTELEERLASQLTHCVTEFDYVYRDKRSQLATATKGVVLSTPDEYWRRVIIAPAAVYILVHLDSFRTLPLLADVFRRPGRLPVSRLFLFYSMHVMAMRYPEADLSPPSLALLRDYRRAAESLQVPTESQVSSWTNTFLESDVRARFLYRTVASSRALSLTTFPTAIASNELPDGAVSADIDSLFEKLNLFIDTLK